MRVEFNDIWSRVFCAFEIKKIFLHFFFEKEKKIKPFKSISNWNRNWDGIQVVMKRRAEDFQEFGVIVN